MELGPWGRTEMDLLHTTLFVDLAIIFIRYSLHAFKFKNCTLYNYNKHYTKDVSEFLSDIDK